MKKILFGTLALSSLLLFSCNKDDGPGEEPVSEVYLNTTAGSTWQYEVIDNTGTDPVQNYTLTSTNRDTTADGQSYHVYENSIEVNEYHRKSGNDYYAFQPMPLELNSTNIANLYLKAGATVNSSWSLTAPVDFSGFSFSVKITHTLVGKGLTKTVNGTTYNNVMDVKTDIGLQGLPPGTVTLTTDIHEFYAPGYGLIERNARANIDFLGTTETMNVTTRLKTATLL